MTYNEEETKLYLINPRLKDWIDLKLVAMEYYFTKGKIIIKGDKVERGTPQKADYLLKYNNIPLAVVEAKEETLGASAGMQQAKGYAETLDIKFAYSSNGHGIEEFDFFTNEQKTIDRFPTPEELWERFHRNKFNSLQAISTLPLLQELEEVNLAADPDETVDEKLNNFEKLLSIPYYSTENKTPRYYQEIAIRRTIESIAYGDRKILLNLATGTGKTFIAFQIAWKLKESGNAKRILFLADRNVLCEQAYNTFEPFGTARDYITEGNTPTAREVYFSIYQAMYADKNGKRIYQHYPKDFFDLIIIDECHRSGFGSWNDILTHFNTAIQLGMTATPKETENINTYKYFGKSENEFKPLYEYSMSQGIEDGFLANFVLHRYKLNTDSKNLNIEEVIEGGATVEVPEGAELRDEYGAKQYELDALLPERTEVMCKKLAEILRKTGEMHKTIVFCVTQDHADEVTKHMGNHFKELGYSNYAVTITSDKPDAESLVKVFQDEITERPVVASTVDLLSTGFDAPSVRNIVFMKYIASPVVFKQILGRGCRISEQTEKYFFRVIDFTNATRLLGEWETGGGDKAGGNRTGNNMLCGKVFDKETGQVIHAARIVLQLSPNQQKIELTDEEGKFIFHGLPEGEVYLQASANKYRNKQMKVETAIDCIEPLIIELPQQGNPSKPIKVTGLNVVFEEETVFEVEITGQRLTLVQYIDYTKQKVTEKFPDAEKLRKNWADRNLRKVFVEDLEKQGINTEILATAIQQPEADELDLLSNIAFNKEIHTRTERADAVMNLQQDFLSSFTDEQRKIIQQLLFYYQLNGADEFVNPKVFELIFPVGGAVKASEKFGNTQNLITALSELQQRVYLT